MKSKKRKIVFIDWTVGLRNMLMDSFSRQIPREHKKTFTLIKRRHTENAEKIPIDAECVIMDFGDFDNPETFALAAKMINAIKKNLSCVKIILLVNGLHLTDVQEALQKNKVRSKVDCVLPKHTGSEGLVKKTLFLLAEC